MYQKNIRFRAMPLLIIGIFYLLSYNASCSEEDLYNEKGFRVPKALKIGTIEHYMADFTQEEDPSCIEETNCIQLIKTLITSPFRINFAEQNITGKELEEIKPLSSTLYGLDLSDNSFNKKELKAISVFTELRFLNLAGSHITDEDLFALLPLTKLNHLILTYNKVTGSGLELLLKFNNLECLNVSCMYWDNNFINIISGFKKLKNLNVSLCKLNDNHLNCFKSMNNLDYIDISGNNFTSNALNDFLLYAKKKGIKVKV